MGHLQLGLPREEPGSPGGRSSGCQASSSQKPPQGLDVCEQKGGYGPDLRRDLLAAGVSRGGGWCPADGPGCGCTGSLLEDGGEQYGKMQGKVRAALALYLPKQFHQVTTPLGASVYLAVSEPGRK